MHVLSHLILTADTDRGLGRLLPQDTPLTSSAGGSQLPSDPMSPLAWPLPSARAGWTTVWHPLIPVWVWALAETEYITNH